MLLNWELISKRNAGRSKTFRHSQIFLYTPQNIVTRDLWSLMDVRFVNVDLGESWEPQAVSLVSSCRFVIDKRSNPPSAASWQFLLFHDYLPTLWTLVRSSQVYVDSSSVIKSLAIPKVRQATSLLQRRILLKANRPFSRAPVENFATFYLVLDISRGDKAQMKSGSAPGTLPQPICQFLFLHRGHSGGIKAGFRVSFLSHKSLILVRCISLAVFREKLVHRALEDCESCVRLWLSAALETLMMLVQMDHFLQESASWHIYQEHGTAAVPSFGYEAGSSEERLERIDDWRVRIKDTCLLTLLQLARLSLQTVMDVLSGRIGLDSNVDQRPNWVSEDTLDGHLDRWYRAWTWNHDLRKSDSFGSTCDNT